LVPTVVAQFTEDSRLADFVAAGTLEADGHHAAR
jgi:hypothetical protein